MQAVFRNILSLALGGTLRIMPVLRHCVVYGWPDTEGNSVEVLRHLIRYYPGRIFWFTSRPLSDLSWLIDDLPGHNRVVRIDKRTWLAVACYLTAEAVFFTHGLFLSPRPTSRRIFVNLWHGDGPKRTENSQYRIRVASSLVVAGTRLWGEYKRRYFDLGESSVAVVGNPRIDQFGRPISNLGLKALGLDPEIPFVLWLPTYREVRSDVAFSWRDAKRLSAQDDIRKALALMAKHSASRGLQILLKPHAAEADQFRGLGIRILTDADLATCRVCFYQLMARSCALITDYSSVWTDYLALKRPIGFFCPDIAEYESGRGLNVRNYASLLPGPLINSAGDIGAFLDSVIYKTFSTDQIELSIKAIGAVTELGAAERLFASINEIRSTKKLNALTQKREDFTTKATVA